MSSIRHAPQDQRFDHLGIARGASCQTVWVPMVPFPFVPSGVQGHLDQGDLLRRQVVITLFMPVHDHAQVWQMVLQQPYQLIYTLTVSLQRGQLPFLTPPA